MLKNLMKKYFPGLYSSQTYLAFGVEPSRTQYPLDKARYLMMARYLHEESVRLGRPLKVLDIGCSEGMMLLYCRKNGTPVRFFGIDILEERKKIALERGYESVLLKDLRQCDFREFHQKFDAVVCSHIIEHLEDPGEFLRRLKAALEPKALLLVGVPIGLWPGILWRRHITPRINPWQKKEAVLKRFGHVSFFTLPDLKRVLLQSGFQAEECRGDFLIRARGFFLENYKWWFDFNQWYGRLLPGVLGHVTVRARLLA